MQAPLFSIVITCYNQDKFIGPAVQSALALDHPSKEVIVVDDGSSDDSVNILERYGDSIKFLRMPKNVGPLAARNSGAAAATGEYLVFFDGDDLFMPWALTVYERIINAKRPKIICGNTHSFSGDVPSLRPEDIPKEIKFVTYPGFLSKDRPIGFSASSFIIDRKEFQHVGGWTLGIFQMDLQDIALKLGSAEGLVLICEPKTVFYRIHAANCIHNEPPFLKMIYHLMERERRGVYPGGRKYLFRRYAWFGGFIFFHVKRALDVGLYKDAIVLGLSGFPMVLAAIIRRSFQWAYGRQPTETLEI